jgi:hypothetical protein
MLCLPYYAYAFSSTKLEIRAEHVLSGNEGKEGDGRKEAVGRNDPNNVHTCE